jgi:bacterioferritin-associated ferredoxin
MSAKTDLAVCHAIAPGCTVGLKPVIGLLRMCGKCAAAPPASVAEEEQIEKLTRTERRERGAWSRSIGTY